MKAALHRAYMSAPVVFLGLLSAIHCRSTSRCRWSLSQDKPQREWEHQGQSAKVYFRVKVQRSTSGSKCKSLLQGQSAKVKCMLQGRPLAHILLAVSNRSRRASLCPAPCTHFLVIACRIFTLGPTSSLTGKYTRRSNLIRENHQRTWRSMTGA